MKNLSLILNFVLVIAVGVLFYLHFKSEKTVKLNQENELVIPQAKMDLKPATIVYVNSDTLMAKYEYVKDVKAESEKERKSSESQFESKFNTFQKEVEEFKEKAQFMTQEQGVAKQAELMEKEQKLTEYRDGLNEIFLKKEEERNDKLLKSISDYMSVNYKNTKYSYVLGYTHGGGIMFAKDSLDITKEVIEGLNNEYKLKKAASKK